MKITLQTITQVEVDTETGRQRLLKGWTKILGEGNGQKSPKKTKKKVDEEASMEEDTVWY